MIDDANSEVAGVCFREEEDAAGYFLVLKQVCLSQGLPQALYADQHTIFQSPSQPTVEQELSGELPRTQLGRLVDELGIQLIAARSPQAKGRIERLWGTLQDRLVKELRQAGACDVESANQVLSAYLPKFNARFQVEAAEPGSAYIPWPQDREPSQYFCFKYTRTVTNDNTISFNKHRLQIPPGPQRRSYAKLRLSCVTPWMEAWPSATRDRPWSLSSQPSQHRLGSVSSNRLFYLSLSQNRPDYLNSSSHPGNHRTSTPGAVRSQLRNPNEKTRWLSKAALAFSLGVVPIILGSTILPR